MLPKAEFIQVNGQQFRIKKDAEEVTKVKEACEISLQAYEEVKKLLKVGMTELEVSNKLGFTKFIIISGKVHTTDNNEK